jgi:hypothetical protein
MEILMAYDSKTFLVQAGGAASAAPGTIPCPIHPPFTVCRWVQTPAVDLFEPENPSGFNHLKPDDSFYKAR